MSRRRRSARLRRRSPGWSGPNPPVADPPFASNTRLTMTTGATAMTTATYHVTGMTCEHCAKAVTAELRALGGVSEVTVDLVPGGASAVTVVSAVPITIETVEAALDEAGDYQLGSPGEPPAAASPDGRLLPVVW